MFHFPQDAPEPALPLPVLADGIGFFKPGKKQRAIPQPTDGFLSASRRVEKAVLLGMDGVYDDRGALDRERTEFLVSNDALFRTVEQFPRLFLPGVSINPYRKDAGEELARCAERGAALVKVLPNAQVFDPSDDRCLPFFKSLALRRLPLLTHVGYEFSLVGQDQSVGDLSRWERALEEGVTVIAAHGASHGVGFHEKHWGTLLEFIRRYPHFYWDSSALTLPNRVGMLMKIRRHPELLERMLFGTDYPVPVYAFPALLSGRRGAYRKAFAEKNPFDRHHHVLESLGLTSPAGPGLSIGGGIR